MLCVGIGSTPAKSNDAQRSFETSTRPSLVQSQTFAGVTAATPGVTALARKEHIHIESRFSDCAP